MSKYVKTGKYDEVDAILYRGNMDSLWELVEFTGLEPHDVYHMTVDWGIVCAITTKSGERIRINPCDYLVRSGKEYFTVPAGCFEKLFEPKEVELGE